MGPTSKGKEGRVGREQEGEGTYTSIGDGREEKEERGNGQKLPPKSS